MKQYPLYNPDYYDNFSALISGIEKYGDNPSIEWFDRSKERHNRSYRELCGDVESLKRALIQKGLSGRHVAIVSENCYKWIISFLAITSSGGVAVCVDIEQPDDTIRQMILQADAEMVIVSPTFHQICAPLLQQNEISSLCVMSGEASEAQQSLDELIKLGESLVDVSEPAIGPNDTAAIMFTSGTTSKSKPVMLSHRNLLNNASSSIAAVDIKKHTFTSLPFYHSYGLTCAILNGLINGSKITVNGDIKTMVRDLLLSNPETFMAVPLMAEALYHVLWAGIEKRGEVEMVRSIMKRRSKLMKLGFNISDNALVSIKEEILGRLKVVITGGAHLNPELGHNLNAFGILVIEGYGITECSPLIAVNRNKFYSFGSVGPVLPGCEVRIVNDEIWVKGPNTMKGYYKNPEATAEVFDGEWFKTGDLGSIDRNGFLTITGRIKNLIVLKNGKKISPEKIEELIMKIPLVKDVLVYGVNTGNSADDVKPAASIYPNPDAVQGMTSYDILEQLQKEINKINITLPPYQQVQMINIREKEFAKTSSKKIKRYSV